jgi:OFA family oxalate/formate antiporter-like MFS transporter
MAQRWFPNRTGFASGIVVTANGLCGFFITPISKYLLEKSGPERAFLVIGTAVTITCILGYIFIKEPHNIVGIKEDTSKINAIALQKQYTVREMLKKVEFYYLFVIMLCGLTAYFIISPISQVLQTQRGISSVVAMWSVMLGSVMNAAMRLLLPSIADKIGRFRCLSFVLAVTSLAMAILTVSQGFFTTVAVVIMYGCFGGIMGNFPSITSQIFGVKHTGENYGYLMISIIGATFLAQLINKEIPAALNARMVFAAGALLAVVALFGTILLSKRKGENNGKSIWVS